LLTVAVIGWAFVAAAEHGQFDDLERRGADPIADDDTPR
jgi:cbb3-type cytochrome oxidase maturation protein